MRAALALYLARVEAGDSHDEAVLAVAESLASEPWRVVQEAGLLSRCVLATAEHDLALGPALQERSLRRRDAIAVVHKGSPYPVPRSRGRRRRGAFDTPAALAREVVAVALAAAGGTARRGLDPACGTGAFLLALTEAGVPEVVGTDVDPLALQVAQIAVPGAELHIEDAFASRRAADVVVGNPPFVAPERQDKKVRAELRQRFPWLKGRFDLSVPFAAVATERVAPGGALGLVLPSALLVQKYGVGLRRLWLEQDRIVHLAPPRPFPGVSVDVSVLVLSRGGGPAPVAPQGVEATAVLSLPNAPISVDLQPGDVELVKRVRSQSRSRGELCLVDTGVVCHGPRGGREALVFAEPGPERVPYADAKEFFAGRHRWLAYVPDVMHRAKSPAMFEVPKIVIQRIRGRGPVRAAIDRTGVYLGHTCTVVVPRNTDISIERLLEVVTSPLVDGLTRLERGTRLDLYPRDVAAFPVPTSWCDGSRLPFERALGLSQDEVARLLALSAGNVSRTIT